MTVKMVGPINSGSAAGVAGSATSNGNSSIILSGSVKGIYVKHNDSPPATIDVTVRTVGTDPSAPSYNLLAKVSSNTDGWFYPQAPATDVAGVAISGEYVSQVVSDYVNVLIAQADAGDSVDVWIMLEY